MVISGRSVEEFRDANYAVLRRFKSDGEWRSASTNHSWETFWTELRGYSPSKGVKLCGLDGWFEVEEDHRGEYIVLEQEHSGMFLSGTFETRLRPYVENGTETKRWNPE